MSSAANILLLGANSMPGWSIHCHWDPAVKLRSLGSGHPPRRRPIDRWIRLDDEAMVCELFKRVRPELIVHCAGVCDVDRCEASPDFAYRVNVGGARNLARHAPKDARIVYCSSDHVFSGDSGPYDEDAVPDPITVYGRTRVAAEHVLLELPNTLVIRSGPWIGPSASGRTGHLDWLRYRHERALPMTVVVDELRSAVWADLAAQRVIALAHSNLTGVRHVTATRPVSRPELARCLVARLQIAANITEEFREDRPVPHLGRVELRTLYADALATPLLAVPDRPVSEGSWRASTDPVPGSNEATSARGSGT